MENFPPNSHKANAGNNEAETEKVEKEKVKRIVVGDVVRRKKPLGKRFVETFIGGDAKGVLAYVMLDVLVPAAKDMLADAVSTTIERMLFGDTRPTNRRSGGRSGYTSYNRYSSQASSPPWARDRDRDEPRAHLSRRAREMHNFDEIILATRPEADEVLDRLYDLISTYKAASVADLYGCVGITADYTDNRWGWTHLQGSKTTRVRDGYLLVLPKPEPLP